MTLTYDADEAPDPDRWLEADEEERIRAVLQYHEALDVHPETENMRAHAGIHAAVETQLAAGDPPVIRDKLETLLEAGIDRHPAVHALAVPLSHVAYGVVDEEKYDDTTDILAHKLEEVTIEDGRSQARTWPDYSEEARSQEERRRPDPEAMKRSRTQRSPDDD